ncbi:MAG TPA: TonB-dependent receptor [Longimicrobiaceae bacterium]|jgi:outer membrane receptor protein involved in Fe transport
MKHIRGALLALAVVGCPAAALAQVPAQGPPPGARPQQGAGGVIRGAVLDAATGKPVPSASVGVWSAADSALVTGAVAGPDGVFRIEGLRPGSYYLKVGALGYAAASPTVALTPQAPLADLGPIRLSASAVALEGLEVTAERSAVALAPDRNTYTARDLAPAGGTATDVLRSVPSVEVDGDGRLSLRGNPNVAVQLNGRAAPMTGDQLAGFLQSLQAGMVERVEVVPNPSAKYDPEGMAGIINIVLKQNTDLGLSGGLAASAGTGDKYTGSGNLGYQKGPMTLFGSYGLNIDARESTGYNELEALVSPNAFAFQRQDFVGQAGVVGHVVNGTAEMRLGKQSSVSGSLLFSDRSVSIDTDNDFLLLGDDQDVLGRRRDFTDNEGSDRSADVALMYRRTVEPQRNELSAELRFNRPDFWTTNLFVVDSLAADGTVVGDRPAMDRTRMSAASNNWTLQLDYTRGLGPRTKLETGYKGALRGLENDYVLGSFSYPQNQWVRSGNSNRFQYDDQVHAVYGVLSQNAGKLDLQAGLRVERTAADFVLTGGDSYANDQTNFFPSGLVSYNLSDTRQVKASYSRRIQRVATQLLNPFAFHEDQRNVVVGNPGLTPEFTDAFELGYQQSFPRGSLQVTPYFRRTEDIIRRTRTVDEETGVSTSTFTNLATSESYGTDMTGSLRLGDRFSGFGSFNVFQMETDGSNVSPDLNTSAFTWSARASMSFKVNPGLDVQGMYMYRAPMNVEQGRVSAFSMTNLSLRQKLRGDRSSLTLRVMDPFNTMRFNIRTDDGSFIQVSDRRFGSRAVFLGVNYNFGRPPRIRQPQPQQQQPEVDPRSGVPGS